MNLQIEKLYRLSAKPSRKIIGLMSGTSLDGLDIALCEIRGSGKQTTLALERFVTIPYDDLFRSQIREIFAKRTIDQQALCGLHAHVGAVHAQLINMALATWGIAGETIDLIASHGQTVYHAPKRILDGSTSYPNSTLQIGDADHIARHTGIITLADFRQKHIAAGGEGAPLAAYGDYLLFADEVENRILLNIGGISNFTYIPCHNSENQAYATDLGPGNTLMNQFMKSALDQEMDEHGAEAARGTVDERLLQALLDDSFFSAAFPKTTGPEVFNLEYLARAQELSGTSDLRTADIMATLNQFSAVVMANGIKAQAEGLDHVAVYVSGGGLHNPVLMAALGALLPTISIQGFDVLGVDPDAKEACLFAVLANETVAGAAEHVTQIKDSPAVCMGKVSFPY
jgi:anhydro-N-acetylmuramic acid kinase